MSLDKRGQLTIFVIIAVVLVLGIIGYFLLRDDNLGFKRYDEKVEILKDDVVDCLENGFGEGTDWIGIQGGYIEVPEPKESIPAYYLSFDVPFYYHEKKTHVPSISRIENEIKEISAFTLESCLENISQRPGYDFIDFEGNNLDVSIGEETITFTVGTMMTVGYDDKSQKVDLRDHPVKISSDIRQMHSLASFIAESLREENEWMPFSQISSLSEEKGLYVDITDSSDGYSSNVAITSPEDEKHPQVYYFKNKYSHDDLEDVAPLLS